MLPLRLAAALVARRSALAPATAASVSRAFASAPPDSAPAGNSPDKAQNADADADAAYLAASGIDSDAPVARTRLEEHYYNTVVDDMMLMSYCHNSPIAPSAAEAKIMVDNAPAEREKRLSLTTLFQTPLEKLPTSPLDPGPPTTNLISHEAAHFPLFRANAARGRFRRRLFNIIDYTTITNKQFNKMDRLLNQQIERENRPFDEHFSPKPAHLPAIRKIVLTIWDEKAVNNKQIILPALFSLESITGAKAEPLFATLKDATKVIRVGMPLGATTTLTPPLANMFLDKLIQTLLPRLREWPGVSPVIASNSGRRRAGVVSLTIPVGSVGAFPDIEPHFDLYPRLFDIRIDVHTTAGTTAGAVALLSAFQMPFRPRAEVLAEMKAAKNARGAEDSDPYAKYRKKNDDAAAPKKGKK